MDKNRSVNAPKWDKNFFRGVGLLSQKQLEQPEYHRRVLARFSHSSQTTSCQQTTPTITQGKYITRQKKTAGGKFESQIFFRPKEKHRERKVRRARETSVGTAASPSGTTSTTPKAGPSTFRVNTADSRDTVDGTGSDDIEGAGQGAEPVHQSIVVSEDSDNDEDEDQNDGFEDIDPTLSWFADTVPVRVAVATPWKAN